MFGTKRRIALFAPLAAFALLLAVGVIMFVGRVAPLVAAERAVVNLGGDMAQRLEATPFGAFPMMIEALGDGVVSVNFEYSDRWTDVSIDFEFHADDANRVYKMLMDFDVDGFAFDVEIHMDQHRIAASSSVLGEEFYGLTYATFREDFRPFAQMLELSDEDFNEIADIVEMIGDIMGMPDPGMEIWEPYTALLRQFILDGTLSSESTTIASRGQDVNVTRAEFRFTDNDMIQLMMDLMTTMAEDSNVDPLGMIDPWMWDEMLSEINFLISELDDFDGYMYVVMYIGPQNRLIVLEVDLHLEGLGTTSHLRFEADFGTSVFDPWNFVISGTTESPYWSDSFEIELVWTFTESANRFVNAVDITVSDNGFEDSGRLVSDWNSNTGVFVLAFEDDRGADAFELKGIYRLDSNGGFTLSFEPIDTGFETFSFEISTQIGANIQPVQDFINFGDIPLGMFLDLIMLF